MICTIQIMLDLYDLYDLDHVGRVGSVWHVSCIQTCLSGEILKQMK